MRMFLLFISMSLLVMGGTCQVNVPFYEPFDDESFLIQSGGLWKKQILKNVDTLRLKVVDHKLKLTVGAFDTVAMSSRSNKSKIRNRAEIFFRPGHTKGEIYYYSWFFLIPADSQVFRDHEITDRKEFHIIAQWHEENYVKYDCAKTQPPVKISYKHAFRKDNLRSIAVSYGLECKDSVTSWDNQSNYVIDRAISKGEWTHFVSQIRWSAQEDGFFKLWINGVPTLLNKGLGKLDTTALSPTKLSGANMYQRSGNKKLIPNYLKLGHYRGEHQSMSSIYFDDFRITREFPPGYKETQLLPNQAEFVKNSHRLVCYPVSQIKFYEFRLINMKTGDIQTAKSKDHSIILSDYFTTEIGETYLISVRTSSQLQFSQEARIKVL